MKDELRERINDLEGRVSNIEGALNQKKFMLNYEQSEREMKFDKWAIRLTVMTFLLDHLILPIFNSDLISLLETILPWV